MNKISAIYVITTIAELSNGRLYLFLKNLSKYSISQIKNPFVIFFDNKLSEFYEKKLLLLLKFLGFYELFSEIEIVNNNIPDELNIYTLEKINNIPKYGTSSGPNLHFYYTMKYKPDKYPIVFLLETDCLFIKDNSIDIINNSIKNLNFWIYGSKYYGNEQMNDNYKDHINGVGVYNRSISFLKFIDELMIYIEDYISSNKSHFINYDIAIHYLIKHNQYLSIDSKEIINISTKSDINITIEYCLLIKPDVLLIHQKIINDDISENEYLLGKILNLYYFKDCCDAIKKNTIGL
uniref:Nucleotide-diphospho-sugar transferase domain-containing protein n=1 Tax=viral metagenome TaxID=1070528 RepID=A0A6C0I082_9ZZZZ